MKAFGKPLMITAGCVSVALSLTASISTNDNPYAVVVARNAFALKPPPPPPVEAAPDPAKAAQNIVLSGITVYDGRKRVSLSITEPGKQNKEYKTLFEGDRSGSLEILEIDEKAWKVKVRNGGQLAMLSFETHGNKTSAPAASAAPKPGVPLPGMPQPVDVPLPVGQPGMRTIPTRNLRVSPNGPQSSISGITMGQTASQPIQQNSNISAEESAIHVALQQQLHQQEIINKTFPPLPPFPQQ